MSNVTLWTITGRGWEEVYEVMPHGSKNLISSTSEEKNDWNEATSMKITETLTWDQFCKRYKDSPHYRK